MDHEKMARRARAASPRRGIGWLIAAPFVVLAVVAGAGCKGGDSSSSSGVAAVASPAVPISLQGINLIDFHLNYAGTPVAPVASGSTGAVSSNAIAPMTSAGGQALQANDLCLTCHGTMLDRQSLDPVTTPEFHKLKLDPATGILKNWKCVDCHRRVDLVARSGGSLRKQVDVAAICYPCHLQGGVGKKLFVK